MKRFLLAIFAIILTTFSTANAQLLETFSGGQIPPGWDFGNGAKVGTYQNPSLACANDFGVITSGIGGNVPSAFLTPAQTYNAAEKKINFSFDFFLLPSNGSCQGATATPPCTITMNVYIVNAATYATMPSGTPTAIHTVLYQVVNTLGNNSINIDVTPFAATMYANYKIFVTFSIPCNLGGKKIYLDNFNLTDFPICTTCPPTANKDFFKLGFGGWISGNLKGNVFGGNTLWAAHASVGTYINKSLSLTPAVDNGTDNDPNNLTLNNMEFIVTTPLTVLNHGCAPEVTPSPGTLNFFSNGTFEYIAGSVCVNSVFFDYTLKNKVSNLTTTSTRVVIELADPIVTPVKFKSFTADRKNASTVNIKWVTASEQDNRGFNVQRNIGSEWKNVAFVFSLADDGNSASDLSYEFNDANSEKGMTQYRIQQVDLDGKASYSEIRAVRGENATTKVLIYPNPSSTGHVNVVFDNSSVRDVLISDIQGRTIKQYSNVTGNILTVENLKSGFYTIKIVDRKSAVSSVEKVVVK